MTAILPANAFVAATPAPKPNITAAIRKPTNPAMQILEKSLSDLRSVRTSFARDDNRVMAACAVDDAIASVKRALILATAATSPDADASPPGRYTGL